MKTCIAGLGDILLDSGSESTDAGTARDVAAEPGGGGGGHQSRRHHSEDAAAARRRYLTALHSPHDSVTAQQITSCKFLRR